MLVWLGKDTLDNVRVSRAKYIVSLKLFISQNRAVLLFNEF
jgi:hypothetical protein